MSDLKKLAGKVALVTGAGKRLGRAVALRGRDTVGMAALLAPLLVLTEPKLPPPSYEVVSTVEIAAPADQVWQRVVSFPEIPPPTEWLFRIGVAAPQRAPSSKPFCVIRTFVPRPAGLVATCSAIGPIGSPSGGSQ